MHSNDEESQRAAGARAPKRVAGALPPSPHRQTRDTGGLRVGGPKLHQRPSTVRVCVCRGCLRDGRRLILIKSSSAATGSMHARPSSERESAKRAEEKDADVGTRPATEQTSKWRIWRMGLKPSNNWSGPGGGETADISETHRRRPLLLGNLYFVKGNVIIFINFI